MGQKKIKIQGSVWFRLYSNASYTSVMYSDSNILEDQQRKFDCLVCQYTVYVLGRIYINTVQVKHWNIQI